MIYKVKDNKTEGKSQLVILSTRSSPTQLKRTARSRADSLTIVLPVVNVNTKPLRILVRLGDYSFQPTLPSHQSRRLNIRTESATRF